MLASSNGAAVTGILATQATAYWATAGATAPNTYTVATTTWREEGGGLYWLSVGSDEWATEGGYSLQVKATGADTFLAYVEVRDRLLSETDDDVISLTTGVTVKTLDTGAIDAKAWATGGLPAVAIATAAATFIADRAFAELATAHQEAGSVGEAWVIARQVLAGYRVANTNSGAVTYLSLIHIFTSSGGMRAVLYNVQEYREATVGNAQSNPLTTVGNPALQLVSIRGELTSAWRGATLDAELKAAQGETLPELKTNDKVEAAVSLDGGTRCV